MSLLNFNNEVYGVTDKNTNIFFVSDKRKQKSRIMIVFLESGDIIINKRKFVIKIRKLYIHIALYNTDM